MKISVIIPAFNATATITKCLKALDRQTFKPAEVIIVDDGSKDGLESEIDCVRPKLKIRNLIILKQNHKGPSQARNLGAKKACGEILAFIDSDCIPPRNWLKNFISAFTDAEVGAVGGGYSAGIDNSFWQRFSYEELLFRRRKRGKFVTTLLANNMACRNSCFWQAGGFPEHYPVCEDMFLAYQIARHHKILWLKDNGIKHHFKTSLKDFLKHQYFFGKHSTIFFLDHPYILKASNHQGKRLHLAIGTSFLSLVCLVLAFVLATINRSSLGQIALAGVGILLIIHLSLYSEFLSYLKKKGLTKKKQNSFAPYINLIRAFVISILRDLVAAVSFFSGLTLYIKEKKL